MELCIRPLIVSLAKKVVDSAGRDRTGFSRQFHSVESNIFIA